LKKSANERRKKFNRTAPEGSSLGLGCFVNPLPAAVFVCACFLTFTAPEAG